MKQFLPAVILISVVAASAVFITKNYFSKPFDKTLVTTWQDLAKGLVLDEEVKIGGFVVPLADNLQEVEEFLLVPDSMSCIHVPPPPANQMVMVKLGKKLNTQLIFGPVWVVGKIQQKPITSEFGTVEYQMSANDVRIYKENPWKK